MSEAVTNAEIEDVLSSIRRLVSENVGEAPQAVAPEAAPHVDAPAEPPVVDKLVLTPAFRVHEAAAPVAELQDAPEPHAAREPEPMLLSDPISEPISEEVAEDALTSEGDEAELAEMAWPEPEEVVETPQVSEVETPESLESRIAELEAVISDTPGDWEPDGSEVEPEEPQTVVFEHAAWAARDGEEVEEAQFIEAEVPVEEAEVISIAPVAEERAETEAATDPDSIEEDAEALFDETFDEAVIDEEVLREMVQKLVREELQGTVGERITRNVRRLVRREIQRALTLREFE
ncbi:hypothetical protein [Aliiroseovarius sp.]|uniref:hypothetical protein n=1 Tax=Aliiroseovarius sp. TaxID=1872442 RepID=UPI003BAC6FD6